MLLTINLNAGQRVTFNEKGRFFRILAATAPLNVDFYYRGAELDSSDAVGVGYWEQFGAEGFDSFALTSATTQTVQFVAREASTVGYDAPPVGNVNIAGGLTGAFTMGAPALSAVNVQALAARSNRRYLLIQNNDPSATVWINVLGNVTTPAAPNIKLGPGESLEFNSYCPSGAINAVSDVPTSNVTFVQG